MSADLLDTTNDDGAPAGRPDVLSSLGARLVLLFEAGVPVQGTTWDLEGLAAVSFGRGQLAGSERSGATPPWLTVTVPDGRMSRVHARLRRLDDQWVLEDAHSRNGTRVNGVRVASVALRDGDVFALGHSVVLFQQAGALALPGANARESAFLTLNPRFALEGQRLSSLAKSRIGVLIQGETGSGKEVVARATHQASGRSGPFVPVNCGALMRTLLESELFGYRKGAFSGALENRRGLVRSADGGTLFLDEIGDLPLDAQASLLRVIQEGEVLPVGDTQAVEVDVRFIAATHRDLRAMVKAQTFRADLLARLAGFTISVPPLRERREDLGWLCRALLAKGGSTPSRVFELSAIEALLGWSWPENVRELERILSAAVLLAPDDPIRFDHLLLPTPPSDEREGGSESRAEQLRELLERFRGNVTAVAASLETSRAQVHRLCSRFELDPREFRKRG